jgi:peroxiredoxin
MTSYESLPPNLPAPEDDGAAAHLPGTSVPPIALRASDGSTVRLDALGPDRTVLYIYPLSGRPGIPLPEGWDDIPGARGCTPEACSFRDHFNDLLEAGAARVYGLSSQDSDYQAELVERLHLPFSMLSDTEHRLASALDLSTFEVDGRRLYKRITLVLRDGRIEHVFYPVFPPGEHAEQVLAWLRHTR